jgi:PncC family amidohydrolase
MDTVGTGFGTAFLLHSPLLEALWNERGNGVRLKLEEKGGYAFFNFETADAALGEEAFLFFEEAFGKKRIRRGSKTPAETLFHLLSERGLMFACAESCTGGLIAKELTDIPGSSGVFTGGVVTYSNEAKRIFLGVEPELITEKGAVSEEVVRAMARGLLERSNANVCLAVTGIAGPEGGTAVKPVGLVWLCAAAKDGRMLARQFQFNGDRKEVRNKAYTAGVLLVETVYTGEESLDSFQIW